MNASGRVALNKHNHRSILRGLFLKDIDPPAEAVFMTLLLAPEHEAILQLLNEARVPYQDGDTIK